MARSERYIPPSDEELRRWREAQETAKRCDEQRKRLLRLALRKTKKFDLVEIALRVAQEEKASEWLLEREVALDKPVDLLVNDVGVAIDMATRVDEERINYNFWFDRRAYQAVRRGLSQLIEKSAIEEAKALALKLMRKGSHQIESSDEGLMQEEIENCLLPVISAVAGSPGSSDWARNMLQCDVTGCVCRRELTDVAGAIGPQ